MGENNWEDPQIGYVIQIPDKKSIIINVGTYDDINLGDEIAVYEEGPQISDSKTQRIIGRRDFIKAILEVTEVYENFSVCQKVTKKTLNKLSYSMSSLLVEKEYIEIEELNVNPEQTEEFKIKKSLIEINDPVKYN